MRRLRDHTTLIVLAALLTLGAGFCLFDSHGDSAEHGHGISVDLCLAMIGAGATVASLAGLAVIGRTVVASSLITPAAALLALELPPERLPLG